VSAAIPLVAGRTECAIGVIQYVDIWLCVEVLWESPTISWSGEMSNCAGVINMHTYRLVLSAVQSTLTCCFGSCAEHAVHARVLNCFCAGGLFVSYGTVGKTGCFVL
jgi:hypothetical protein